MKTKLYRLLILFFVITVSRVDAQTYHPLPTQNAYWTVYEWDEFSGGYDDKIYTVDGDTLINGWYYTKVFQLNDYPTIYDTIRSLHCLMRQDTTAKKIWFIRSYLGETTEKLGYDFSVNVGDTVSLPAFDYGNVGDSIYHRIPCYDVVLKNGEIREQFCFSSIIDAHPIQIIEGVTGYNNTFPDKYLFWDPFHQTYSECVMIEDFYLWVLPSDSTECGFNLVNIKEINNNQLRIYPNPANYFCQIELPYAFGEAEIDIFDFLGKTVLFLKPSASEFVNMDMSKIPSGIYLLKLETPYQTFINKLVVQH